MLYTPPIERARRVFVPRTGGSEHASALVEQQLVLGRPAVGVDAVEDVACVMVDGAQCADDSEALVACRLDAGRTLVERSLYQHSTRLRQQQQRRRLCDHQYRGFAVGI